MTELTGDIPTSIMLMVGGIVLLLTGFPFGRDLITLSVGIHIGVAAK